MIPNNRGQSLQLLIETVKELNASKINYVVIGALAGAFLGNLRSSADADALLFLPDGLLKTTTPEKKVFEILNNSRLSKFSYLELFEPDLFDPIRGMISITDDYQNKVDLLLGISGIDDSITQRSVSYKIFEDSLNFLSAEDFIIMKLIAGSVLDLEDARNVYIINKQSIDKIFIEKFLTKRNSDLLLKFKQIISE